MTDSICKNCKYSVTISSVGTELTHSNDQRYACVYYDDFILPKSGNFKCKKFEPKTDPVTNCDKLSQDEEQRYEVSNLLLAALWYLRRNLEIYQLNCSIDSTDPFGNNAVEFKNDAFHVVSYDWVLADQDKEQEYNFRWRDIKIWWYKYLGRGTECNQQLTNDQIEQMLEECLESLNENDIEVGTVTGIKTLVGAVKETVDYNKISTCENCQHFEQFDHTNNVCAKRKMLVDANIFNCEYYKPRGKE